MDQMLPSPSFNIPSIGTPHHAMEEDQMIAPSAQEAQQTNRQQSNLYSFGELKQASVLFVTELSCRRIHAPDRQPDPEWSAELRSDSSQHAWLSPRDPAEPPRHQSSPGHPGLRGSGLGPGLRPGGLAGPGLSGHTAADHHRHHTSAPEHRQHRQHGRQARPQEDRPQRQKCGVQPQTFCCRHHENQRAQDNGPHLQLR